MFKFFIAIFLLFFFAAPAFAADENIDNAKEKVKAETKVEKGNAIGWDKKFRKKEKDQLKQDVQEERKKEMKDHKKEFGKERKRMQRDRR